MAIVKKYDGIYTTVYQATVDQVAKDRHTVADASFPELKEQDFASEEEYKKALQKQYQAIREEEYKYVVQNETLKAFNVSYGNNQYRNTRCENKEAWNGYQGTMTDSCFVRTEEIAKKSDGHAPGNWCCAISATSMTAQISGKMGYDGKDNLIQPKSRIVNGSYGRKNNPGAAGYLNELDSIPLAYRINNKDVGKAPTLNEAIKQGTIKVGDEFSIATGKATTHSTGCHAMVLAGVQYGEDGKTVVSYTLQGNNPPTLKQVDANDPDYYGNRKVVCVTKTNQWVKDKDAEKTKDMSAEDLQKEIAASRQKISSTIDDIKEAETEYIQNKRYNKPIVAPCQKIDKDGKPFIQMDAIGKTDGYGEHYNEAAEELHKEAIKCQEEQIVLSAERENAQKEAELKEREAAVEQKEKEYTEKKDKFLEFHPEKEEVLAQTDQERREKIGTPETPEPVAVPPVVETQDFEQRKKNAMERKDALEKKECEIEDREFNVTNREADLAIEVANTPKTKEEKKAEKEAQKAQQNAPKEEKTTEVTAPQATNDGEPTGKVVGIRIRQQADFKDAYFDASVKENTQVEAAQKENERIFEQQKKAQQSNTQTPPQTTRTVHINNLLDIKRQR